MSRKGIITKRSTARGQSHDKISRLDRLSGDFGVLLLSFTNINDVALTPALLVAGALKSLSADQDTCVN